jgi:hypothetical protein
MQIIFIQIQRGASLHTLIGEEVALQGSSGYHSDILIKSGSTGRSAGVRERPTAENAQFAPFLVRRPQSRIA